MIAITGASGLLGSFIASKFTLQGEDVIGLTRQRGKAFESHQHQKEIKWKEVNILDSISLMESLKDVHTVIHSAALVSFNPRRRKEIFETNVIGTRNVVDCCLAAGVKKLIHISSVAALGRPKGVSKISETSLWMNDKLNPDYALSKYQAELEVYRGYEEGLNVSIVNPSVILAPSDWNYSSARIFKYIWNENSFYIHGFINYVDVRDVANLIYELSLSDYNGERFIASASNTSFKNLFDEIAKRFNKKPPYIKVYKTLVKAIAYLEEVRSFLTNQEPILTKQTAEVPSQPFYYDHKKTVENLKINFQSLDETLDFCCHYYLQHNTTNK
jgi:dihydroflavonol-4-reductase